MAVRMGNIDATTSHLVHAFASYIASLSAEHGCDEDSGLLLPSAQRVGDTILRRQVRYDCGCDRESRNRHQRRDQLLGSEHKSCGYAGSRTRLRRQEYELKRA